MPVGNNDAPIKASSAIYSQNMVFVKAVERGASVDSGESARNWLDGIYGSTKTTIKYPTFQPLTYSMNYINHNDAFNIAKAMTEDGNIYGLTNSSDSHLMKNSEWGAITYLSQSQYGLGNVEICVNNISLNSGNSKRINVDGKSGVDSVYAVTGCTTAYNDAEEKITTIEKINSTVNNTAIDGIYTWDQLNGTKASSTGNIYGIYDLSGGLEERTTAYIANAHEYLSLFAKSITYDANTLKTASTKYTTAYPFDSSVDNTEVADNDTNLNTVSTNNYKKNTLIYGDGIRETSTTGIGSTSWYNDYSYYMGLFGPVSVRGGDLWTKSGNGLFHFHRTTGDSSYADGLRVTLVVF
ncbi:MAG: hypothetical protein ACLU84_07260 [Clostridia bacterium]